MAAPLHSAPLRLSSSSPSRRHSATPRLRRRRHALAIAAGEPAADCERPPIGRQRGARIQAAEPSEGMPSAPLPAAPPEPRGSKRIPAFIFARLPCGPPPSSIGAKPDKCGLRGRPSPGPGPAEAPSRSFLLECLGRLDGSGSGCGTGAPSFWGAPRRIGASACPLSPRFLCFFFFFFFDFLSSSLPESLWQEPPPSEWRASGGLCSTFGRLPAASSSRPKPPSGPNMRSGLRSRAPPEKPAVAPALVSRSRSIFCFRKSTWHLAGRGSVQVLCRSSRL
mmetsp:Transcript_112880/g.221346  ORF Transcript_112880/g.221346 Transcript_112880/m.221346 type:complete len:279 (+) Transcript_112880:272-1108(+)